MYEVRKLSSEDLPLIVSKLEPGPQKYAYGHDHMPYEEYLAFTTRLLSYPGCGTWGFFEDGELVSFMTAFDFQTLPYYGLTNFKVLKKFNFYNSSKNGWTPLIEKITEVKEKEQRYTFFAGQAARSFNVRRKTAELSVDDSPSFWNRYMMTIEEYIPANNPSKFDFFNKAILRDKIFTSDFIVFKFTCKNIYRDFTPVSENGSILKSKIDLLDN